MRLSFRLALALSCVVAVQASAQSNITRRDTNWVNRSANPVLSPFRFRSVGPASMGGRIDDIAVYEKDPRIIYVGYAMGGVFKSTNAGTTFSPIFETYGSASIGDIAVDQRDPNVVWVGTGEPNNRQTSSFGDGIYKSTDGGKTFTNVGLKETQSIGRIVIDPRNSNVVYVASPGHLFGPNTERGVFKTTDGGKTWSKIKYIDENTGFNDIAIDPSNPNTLYASSYQRRRSGCCFSGGGPGSGLWKTDNGGASWTTLSGGLPPGNLGRIGVDIARSNANVVYAQVQTDGADSAATFASAAGGFGRGGYDWCSNGSPTKGFAANTPDSLKKVPALNRYRPGLYRSENKGKTWTLVSNCNGRPMYFSQVRVDPTNDKTVYVANVMAAKSLDGGKSFAQIDSARGSGNEMVDQHAFWIDPHNSDHILRGADAGFAVTWDQGETWEYVHMAAAGLAYWVSADMNRPYNIYLGLQDNDSWGGPSAKRSRNGIRDHDWFRFGGGDGFQTAVDPTNKNVVFSESQDGNTQRTDLSTGVVKSIRPIAPPAGRGAATPAPGTCVDGRSIPQPATGAAAGAGAAPGGGGLGRGGGAANVVNAQPGDTYRFNWNTPYMLSPHDPSVVWLGGNRLFRSSNQGDLWVASADLTKQIDRCNITLMGTKGSAPWIEKNDGMTNWGTIISVSESPVIAGIVWAGTDDGNLQLSRDNGATFTEVGKNISGLPSGALSGENPYWISRIEASHFDAATAYVAIDGHRADDLTPYVFVTRDYGASWQRVSGALPTRGNVQVIREDPKNKNLLYAGTEFGLFISLDGGTKWEPFMTGYPVVRTDDILVHPRDGDLIVATHGRSIWIADDITPLQQWTPSVAAADATLFDVRTAVAYANDVKLDVYTGGDKQFEGENPQRGTAVHFYLKSAGDAKVTIADQTGRALCETNVKAVAGMNRVQWTLVAPMLAAAAPAPGGRGGGAGGPGAGGGRGAGAPPAGGAPPAAGATPAPVAAPATPAQPAAPAPDMSCAPSAAGGGGGRGGAAAGATPGSYVVKLSVGGKEYTKTVQVLEDRWMRER